MAQQLGPCTRAKALAKLSGSAFRMKFTSPWRYSVTSFDLCRATAVKPMVRNNSASCLGVGGGVFDELEAVGAHRVRRVDLARAGRHLRILLGTVVIMEWREYSEADWDGRE